MATATKERKKTSGLKFQAGDLLETLTAVVKAKPGHTPKPILHNVRIGDGLMTATDLEVRIDAEIGQHCEPFLVSAARLQQILRSVAKDADVSITPNGTSVTIETRGGKWEIPTEDAAEFPTWDVIDAKPVTTLPADQFARNVRSVVYATDSDSSRYALGGMLIEVIGSHPVFVATDGRRLSSAEMETDQALDDWVIDPKDEKKQKRAPLVPARAIELMEQLSGKGKVQIDATAREIVCTTDIATITARLLEGRFPAWRDVFPKRDVEASVLLVRELEAAVRAASVCTSEQSKGVVFKFGSVLELTSQSAEAGKASVTCDVTTPGQPARVKLEPRFVLDFLAGLDANDEPHVEVEAAGPGDAVILRCGDVRGVIMPLAGDA
jgi:DNA polymerase-3 subunit beta